MINEVAVRIARPRTDLAAAERFYVHGLGLDLPHRIAANGPEEHDLVILGWRHAAWHLELVGGPNLTTRPAPTSEDPLVLYLGAPVDEAPVARLERAGGSVVPQGAYRDRFGVTVRDPDVGHCLPPL
ncbi:VOC family protein [Polymorphospora sp. NPDC051019]|uniref:VOC family protein n=1 Tax=Polymorphospora sp. NPDC051019 TaxID=3155725 RepID=UPI0034212AD1